MMGGGHGDGCGVGGSVGTEVARGWETGVGWGMLSEAQSGAGRRGWGGRQHGDGGGTGGSVGTVTVWGMQHGGRSMEIAWSTGRSRDAAPWMWHGGMAWHGHGADMESVVDVGTDTAWSERGYGCVGDAGARRGAAWGERQQRGDAGSSRAWRRAAGMGRDGGDTNGCPVLMGAGMQLGAPGPDGCLGPDGTQQPWVQPGAPTTTGAPTTVGAALTVPCASRGVCTQAPCYCIIMEFCAQGQLYEVLRAGRKVTPSLLVDWSMGIAGGMNYLHLHKIIHRDLKSPK